MENITITLNKLEQKVTKGGQPMWTAHTSAGLMSIFEPELAADLQSVIGKNLDVAIEKKGTYTNLVGCVGLSKNAPVVAPQKTYSKPFTPYVKKSPEDKILEDKQKLTSMLISYSKDLVVAGKIGLNDVEKQAKEFKRIYEELLK